MHKTNRTQTPNIIHSDCKINRIKLEHIKQGQLVLIPYFEVLKLSILGNHLTTAEPGCKLRTSVRIRWVSRTNVEILCAPWNLRTMSQCIVTHRPILKYHHRPYLTSLRPIIVHPGAS